MQESESCGAHVGGGVGHFGGARFAGAGVVHGGGFRSFGGFHRAGFHHNRFFFRHHRRFLFAGGYWPYDYGNYGCWRRVPWHWGWRRVWVCNYNYGWY